MATQTQRIAFFGATGDCAGYCLAFCLQAGYSCTALARTTSKLTASMKAKGVSTETLGNHLTITSGNAKDIADVKKALVLNGQVVDMIVSGLGAAPVLQWSLRSPATSTDPTICQDAGETMLAALKELKPAKKPFLINVSTTGIQAPGAPVDLPWVYTWLYPWFGHVMHEDKRVLQFRLAEEMRKPDAVLGGHVNVKPSLLMDGEECGLEKVRVGGEQRPPIGYTIRRKDVGRFIAEKLVMRETDAEWVNKSVIITY